MKTILFLTIISVLIFSVKTAKKLPSYAEQCYRDNDDELSACLVRNVEKLTKSFPHGLPELRVPDLDPFLISSATLANDNNLNLVLKNIKLYHIDKLMVNIFRITLNKEKKLYLEGEFPNVGITSEYQVKGKVLVLNLDSQGTNTANLTHAKLVCHAELDLRTVNNVDYLNIKNVNLTGTIGPGTFNFKNLFKDSEELNDRANQLINENSKVIIDELTPVLMDLLKTVFAHVVQNTFSKYPFEVLFPIKNN